jgi:hypothetical protein
VLADLAGEGLVTATDASQVAQVAVHRPGLPNITPVPPGAQVAPSQAPDPTLSLPKTLSMSPESTVSVPVDLNEARPAGSTGLTEATLALRFDPSVFTLSSSDIHLGSIPQAGNGWTLTSAVDDVTGQIGITLWSLTPIASNLAGSLVTIDFYAQPGAAMQMSSISLAASVEPAGQGAYMTNVADTNGAMILGLAPMNGADGHIAAGAVLVTPTSTTSQASPTMSVARSSVEPAVAPQASESTIPAIVMAASSRDETPDTPTTAAEMPMHRGPGDGAEGTVVRSVVSWAETPATFVVFAVGVPAITPLAPWTDQYRADQVFLLAEGGAMDLGFQSGPSRESTDLLARSLEPADTCWDNTNWDRTPRYRDLAIAQRLRDHLETTSEQCTMVRAAIADIATLDRYFAGAWADDGPCDTSVDVADAR